MAKMAGRKIGGLREWVKDYSPKSKLSAIGVVTDGGKLVDMTLAIHM